MIRFVKGLYPLVLMLGFLLMTNVSLAQSIDWTSLKEAQTKASESGKKVLIYAEAEWCGYCKRMNKNVFPQRTVRDSLKKYFHPVRIDIDSTKKEVFNDEEFTQQMLARKFRVTGTPTMIFVSSDGEILGIQPGFIKADIFDKLLAYVGSDLFHELRFKEYLNKYGVTVRQ